MTVADIHTLPLTGLVDLICDDNADCRARAAARTRLKHHLAAGGDLPTGSDCRRILHRFITRLDQPSGRRAAV